jgi:protein AATF/BFR2
LFCRKSKLRKPEEVVLGPQYAGSRISREELLDNANNEDEEDSEADPEEEEGVFANPEDVELDVDEDDGDIDSEAAFGESDAEKFKGFTFRGSNKPKVALDKVIKKRPTAADFMSSSEDEDAPVEQGSGRD